MFHQVCVRNINGFVVAVQVNNDSYGNSSLSSCYGNNEYGKEYPVELISKQVFIEGYEVNVDSIQYQLNRHQHGDHIATGEEPINADEEQRGADEQQM
jgi:hypothetical protein